MVLPSVLKDSTAFWLDREGWRLLETSRVKKKVPWESDVFFNKEKSFLGRVPLRAEMGSCTPKQWLRITFVTGAMWM